MTLFRTFCRKFRHLGLGLLTGAAAQLPLAFANGWADVAAVQATLLAVAVVLVIVGFTMVEECCVKGKTDCPAFSTPSTRLDPGYACTRPKGHSGEHVACLPWRHRVRVWAPEPSEEKNE